MNRFIIATHSTLAEGFWNALKFFNQDIDNVEFLNCYVETNEVEKELRERLEQYPDDNLIVLTDIAGGSVNQTASKLMKEYSFHLITGINLGLLLELVFTGDELNDEMIAASVSQAQSQMIYMNRAAASEADDDSDDL
ncbi:MAG: PTS N-acetylglucosamine transporter subunit IIBC [Erysipelotrichaceae bacterium]|jgi:PTS system mannose-specific IIA component/fructoselysine and glucoselysine-specific PTS system IIA component|nr:PTS N-acetylglucosamine transporter subunit IIBC [Erysipelotrichaceae bacterium]